MKRQLHKQPFTFLFSIFCFLFSVFCFAQDYQYQWAKSGGGGLSGSDSVFNERQDETIRDVVVDADNNYYFLANLQGGTINYEGISFTHYGGNDILILALDCGGNLLWHHTIGGRYEDQAYKLGLDSTNGLYIGVNVHNSAYIDNNGYEHNFPPVHFSEDDVMPLIPYDNGVSPSEGYKRGFLLKFDKDTGELLWRKDLQGMVTNEAGIRITTGRIFIDSNDIIHQIVGLSEGVHLDGLVTVTEVNLQFFLVKYDTDGNILGTPAQLPMTSGTGAGFNHDNTIFMYDEQLNRYYLAGQAQFFQPLTYGGVALQQQGGQNGRLYILAFDGSSFDELWSQEIHKEGPGFYGDHIRQIVIDENSNIYMSGKYVNSSNSLEYFGDYLLPQSIGTYNSGHTPFILKMNSEGVIQWVRTPDGYTADVASTGLSGYCNSLTINGNEIAATPNGSAHIWGDFSVVRPQPNGHQQDPVLLRLNKETGEVIGLHDIMGANGPHQLFTVITTDNDGNYIAGGHFSGYQGLFTDSPNGVGPLSAMGKTDFFMAKLSAYACGSGGNPCLGVEIDAPTGNSTQTVTSGMTLADLEVD